MEKYKILAVALIGILMAVGLVLAACETETVCLGDGDCSVEMAMGAGIYIVSGTDKHHCGKEGYTKYTDNGSYWVNGCNIVDYIKGHKTKSVGTKHCDCASGG